MQLWGTYPEPSESCWELLSSLCLLVCRPGQRGLAQVMLPLEARREELFDLKLKCRAMPSSCPEEARACKGASSLPSPPSSQTSHSAGFSLQLLPTPCADPIPCLQRRARDAVALQVLLARGTWPGVAVPLPALPLCAPCGSAARGNFKNPQISPQEVSSAS